MKAVLFLSLCALAVVCSVPVPWRGCGDSPAVRIESIDASVWPVTRGKPENVSFHVVIQQPITGGTWDFSLTYAGQLVWKDSGYLRDVVNLPIQPGPFSKSFSATVPKEVRDGNATIHINIKDDNENPIVCVDVDVKFVGAQQELPPPSLFDLTPIYAQWQQVLMSKWVYQFHTRIVVNQPINSKSQKPMPLFGHQKLVHQSQLP